MTTEGMHGAAMDTIEMKHSVLGLAEATAVFKKGLVASGFTEEQAFDLTRDWLRGLIAGGKA